jgi:hypothetical protein
MNDPVLCIMKGGLRHPDKNDGKSDEFAGDDV